MRLHGYYRLILGYDHFDAIVSEFEFDGRLKSEFFLKSFIGASTSGHSHLVLGDITTDNSGTVNSFVGILESKPFFTFFKLFDLFFKDFLKLLSFGQISSLLLRRSSWLSLIVIVIIFVKIVI